MGGGDLGELMWATVWTISLVGGPLVLSTLIVGSIVAVLQALTQIQEMTLTFVPKLIAIAVTMAAMSTFIAQHLQAFTDLMFSRVESGFPG